MAAQRTTTAAPHAPAAALEPPRRPACMHADEFARWRAANTALHGGVDRAASPCQDCTPAFADEMHIAGRCRGWPGTARPTRGVPA